MSDDGGSHWSVWGSAVASSVPQDQQVQVVASSTQRVWSVIGTGRLEATTDGGQHWTSQPVPVPVVQLSLSGDVVWVLSCPPTSPGTQTCTPVVETASAAGSRWHRMPFPVGTARVRPAMTVTGPQTAVVTLPLPDKPGGAGASAFDELVVTADAGNHWAVQQVPAGPGGWCAHQDGTPLLTGIGQQWWMLCNGPAVAGSSTKAVLATTDSGQHWAVAAALTDLGAAPVAGALPRAEPAALQAGGPDLLWLATTVGLTESTDGGVTWRNVDGPMFDGSPFTAFDALQPSRAWVLVPGGLWSTSDGTTWQRLG